MPERGYYTVFGLERPFPWSALAWPFLWVAGLVAERPHRPVVTGPHYYHEYFGPPGNWEHVDFAYYAQRWLVGLSPEAFVYNHSGAEHEEEFYGPHKRPRPRPVNNSNITVNADVDGFKQSLVEQLQQSRYMGG